MTYELGILGAGNMAEAIVRGVLRSLRLPADKIIVADVAPARRDLFSSELHITAVEDNLEVARQSRTVLISVKPQQAKSALEGIGAVLDANSLVISIMAGISISFIESALGADKPWHVIRTMPNTPMLVGEGMVAISQGQHATAKDVMFARSIFESAASIVEVTEDKIDAVTAISGSGPAYFYFLVEQMIQAGIDMGLTPVQARLLATKTAAGAGTMLKLSSDSPAELRRKVTSPGGTTQAAITYLETNNAAGILIDAMKAAQKRSKELAM
jgi:pyrroline-5-carboxylate reductase